MTDCAEFRLDTNPCSETYNTYKLFDIPCPSVIDQVSGVTKHLIMISNPFKNVLFKCEFVNSVTSEKMTIAVNDAINHIYLDQGVYRICFYENSDLDYILVSANQLSIFSGSCRNNVSIIKNIEYSIIKNEQ